MRPERIKPSARCVHCGKRIEAEDHAEVQGKYTDHVVAKHGKPATAAEANRP